MNRRNAALAAVHIHAREVSLIEGKDKSAWRVWLAQRFSGVTSASDLADSDLYFAIDLLKGGASALSSGRPLLDKIRAQLAALGKTERYADGIARNMFKKDRLVFCTDPELRKVVAALTYAQKRAAAKAKSGSASNP